MKRETLSVLCDPPPGVPPHLIPRASFTVTQGAHAGAVALVQVNADPDDGDSCLLTRAALEAAARFVEGRMWAASSGNHQQWLAEIHQKAEQRLQRQLEVTQAEREKLREAASRLLLERAIDELAHRRALEDSRRSALDVARHEVEAVYREERTRQRAAGGAGVGEWEVTDHAKH